MPEPPERESAEGFGAEDGWNESDHPRDKDGKFGTGGGSVSALSGNEISESLTAENVVAATSSYFKSHLAGRSVNHPQLGQIKMTISTTMNKIRGGLHFDIERAKLVPALPEILSKGVVTDESEPNKSSRFDRFYYIEADVDVGPVTYRVGVTVGRDRNGKFAYNINRDPADLLSKKKGSGIVSGIAPVAEPSSERKAQDLNITQEGEDFNLDILSRGDGEEA